VSLGLIVGVQVMIVGFVLYALTPAFRRHWPNADGYLALGRTAAIVIGIALVAVNLSGGQTPLANTPNPVPDQVTSVDAGYKLYQANCAACHGVDGNGGGPLAGTTPVQPPSLRAHLTQHTDGDLFYWISNGLPGGMPAWSSKMSETDRWNLVNYLRSINGQGPTPAASPTAAHATDGIAVLVPIGWAVFFGGWLAAGARRTRRNRPRSSMPGR
jgi:mono/diheme cytochrome c family protein